MLDGNVIGGSSADNSYGQGYYDGSYVGKICRLDGAKIAGSYNIRYEGDITL